MTDVTETKPVGLTMTRTFTKPGVHPYDEVTWKRQDVVMTNWRDGTENFRQEGVEFPDFWSPNAVQIVTTKYFRGAVGTQQREWSLRQLIDRVVKTYTQAGYDHGYFTSLEDSKIFEHELTYMLLHHYFNFNSPVWFNVGTSSPQQVSACFLLSVDDTMESILNWYREEGLIFKGGSGSGVNLSRIRSSKELLSSGGTASGPVSFMRGADASAGTIKSGGATRRAAKMAILDVDHPDIREFVESKSREELKIKALRDAGFDMDLGGADVYSVQYQNANNSVRVSDEFMRAVESGGTFGLRARTTGEVIETIDAAALFKDMCKAAWECADPGIQYDDTINAWHTCPESGRITTSNPCAEYLHLDNSSCNLASINLLKFLYDDEHGNPTFDVGRFIRVVEYVITAMDISVSFADFPTEKITEVSRAYRQLGLGYANLGAMLMAAGYAYDSTEGQRLAGAVTSLMTAVAYRRSAEIAAVLGPYDGYEQNALSHRAIMQRHERATRNAVPSTYMDSVVWKTASAEWSYGDKIGMKNGWRNAQTTLLAPTGTSGLAMDVDTTGVEPFFALVVNKKLVGGGSMQIVAQVVRRSLERLGYQEEQIEAILTYIAENGHVVDAPGLHWDHYKVFDCAVGRRSIAPMGHVRMLAAVQPFLSGAISKTVNMPEDAPVEAVEEIYMQSWKMGLKALAIYRDNCKVGQPASTVSKKVAEIATPVAPENEHRSERKRLPRSRTGITTSFSVGDAECYTTANLHPDNGLGELFIKMSKQGSTLAGMTDAFAIAVSIGLQYGVPLETFVRKFVNMRFEPAGMTDDPDIRFAHSIMDYIFKRLALDFLSYDQRSALGIYSIAERNSQVESEDAAAEETSSLPIIPPVTKTTEREQDTYIDAPLCMTCGTKMRPAGACYVCEGCGSASGCS